jgi:hypothetical protein
MYFSQLKKFNIPVLIHEVTGCRSHHVGWHVIKCRIFRAKAADCDRKQVPVPDSGFKDFRSTVLKSSIVGKVLEISSVFGSGTGRQNEYEKAR